MGTCAHRKEWKLSHDAELSRPSMGVSGMRKPKRKQKGKKVKVFKYTRRTVRNGRQSQERPGDERGPPWQMSNWNMVE